MSRFNTGNPLGSGSPLDLDDNAKNMDLAVNAEADTFQDRLGRSRLTWAGVVRAGSGDPAIAVDAAARAEAAASQVQQDAEQIAQDAAQQAVSVVVDAVDGSVDRAEGAADRAEAAADAAFVNADVYPDVATGRAAVADGEQFQVLSADGLEYIRYRKDSGSVAAPVGRMLSPTGLSSALDGAGVFSENLFDGVWVNLGTRSASNTLAASLGEFSAVIPVTPGVRYYINKQGGDRYRVVTTGGAPKAGEPILRWIKSGETDGATGKVEVTAQDGDNFLLVWCATTPGGGVTGVSLSIVAGRLNLLQTTPNIQMGKNLFNGVWQHGTISGTLGAPAAVTTNNGKYAIIPIRPGTDYTVSKTGSNRFKVAEWPLSMTGGVVLEDNNSGNEFSFTSGPNAAYLGIYAAFGDAPPPNFMQVEEAAARTEWERFGYKFTPAAEPYFKDSGGGGSSDPGPDVDVTGVEDATEALNYYFAQRAGREAPLPAGRLRVTGTVYYDGETLITGKGRGTQLFLGDGFSLDPVTWRESQLAYPIFCSRDGADFAVLRDFTIVGNRNQMVDHRQFGVAVVDADHVKIENVGAEYINFFPDLAGGATTNALAWNLAILRSKHASVTGGLFRFGGYENIGTEDAEDILFNGVRAGIGWRTSVQFHRGSQDIRWIGGSIYQNHEQAHSALTMHGTTTAPVIGVLIDGLVMKSTTSMDVNLRHGGIQSVEKSEHEVTIANSRIIANNTCIASGSYGVSNPEPCKDWKILNTNLVGSRGIWLDSTRAQLDGMTISASIAAVQVRDASPTIGVMDLLDNKEVVVVS